MKKCYALYRILIVVAIGFVLPQMLCAQVVTVDVSTFNGQKVLLKADLSKDFELVFTKNKVDASLSIRVASEALAPVTVKKGINETEKSSFRIHFTGDRNGPKVNGTNGRTFVTSTPVQIIYGTQEIEIAHEQSAPEANGGKGGKRTQDENKKPITGIELHDAILAKRFLETGSDSLLIMLARLKTPPVKATDAEIKAAYASNPFIAPLLTQFISQGDVPVRPFGGAKDAIGSFVSKVGNTDVTTVVDGVARFLVKRTKEELNTAFFQHFKDLLNKEEFKDVQILFPKAMITLNAIGQDIYLFENYITTLRESFQSDLSLLLDHMPDVIEEGRYSAYFTSKPNLKYSLLIALVSAQELVNGIHPGKVLEDFPTQYIDGLTEKNAQGAIYTVQLISSSLRARGGSRYWTTSDSVRLLADKKDKESVVLKFYLGFLYEKGKDISFENKTLAVYLDAIAKSEPDIRAYLAFVTTVGQRAQEIESAIELIRTKGPDTPAIDVYNRLFNSFADLADHINTVGTLPGIMVDGKIMTAVTDYLKIFRQTNDLALNVTRKSYGSAIVNVQNIYLVAMELKKRAEDPLAKNPTNKELFVAAKPTGTGKAIEKATLKINKDVLAAVEMIKTFGTFMSNVAKAESPAEVEAAIDAAALPAGSSTIKKHSNISVSLNAYVGLFIGAEKIDGIDEKFEINNYGITAPIGIAFNKGWNTGSKNAWSTSLFFSIVDLGAPVAFRFEDEKTEEIPSVKLEDIVSPGVFLSIGLPRVPLSVNAGLQKGPILRDIDPDYATLAATDYLRWSISIVVDIPILNFYKSAK